MSEICAEAKMSPGALYRYYPSKDAIIEAIAEEERLAAGACLAGLHRPGPIADRLTDVALDYLASARDPETGCLQVEICSESLRNTAVGERFRTIEADVQAQLRAVVEEAKRSGEVPADLDVEVVLALLMSIGDGMVLRLQLDPTLPAERIRPTLLRMAEGLLGTVRP